MRSIAILLWWVLLVGAAPAAAQTTIHRCIGANGNPLFTDQPCAALQATSLSPVAKPDTVGNVAGPPPILCAANRDELKQSVIEAFANHDANRMAGLMLWSGIGRGAAVADIRALSVAMRQTLLDVETGDAGAPAAYPLAPADSASLDDDPFAPSAPLVASAPLASHLLLLHTTGNDGSGSPRALRFSIVRRSGCLWLRNAD